MCGFIAFLALSLDVLWLSHGGKVREPGTIRLAQFSAVLWSSLTLLTLWVFTRLRLSTVNADADGLWYANQPKESGLLRWDEVTEIRAREFLRRLDVIDWRGDVRLKVDYQLSGFELLRAVLLSAAANQSPPSVTFPVTFCRLRTRPVIALGFILLLSLGCWYVARQFGLAVGIAVGILFAGLTLLALYEHLSAVVQLVVHIDHFELHYPFSSTRAPFRDVLAVQLADVKIRHHTLTEVRLWMSGSTRPICLGQLARNQLALYQLLESRRQASDPAL
jgi:hypothetical protein